MPLLPPPLRAVRTFLGAVFGTLCSINYDAGNSLLNDVGPAALVGAIPEPSHTRGNFSVRNSL